MHSLLNILRLLASATLLEFHLPVRGTQQKSTTHADITEIKSHPSFSSVDADGSVVPEPLRFRMMRREQSLSLSEQEEVDVAGVERGHGDEAGAEKEVAAEDEDEAEQQEQGVEMSQVFDKEDEGLETRGIGVVPTGGSKQLLQMNEEEEEDEEDEEDEEEESDPGLSDEQPQQNLNNAAETLAQPGTMPRQMSGMPQQLMQRQQHEQSQQEKAQQQARSNQQLKVVTKRGGKNPFEQECVYFPGYKLGAPRLDTEGTVQPDAHTWEQCLTTCRVSFEFLDGLRCQNTSYTLDHTINCTGWTGLEEWQCEDKCAKNERAPNCPQKMCTGASYYKDIGGCYLHDKCERQEPDPAVTGIIMSVHQQCHQVQFEQSARGTVCKTYSDWALEEAWDTSSDVEYMAAICNPPPGHSGPPGPEGKAGGVGYTGPAGEQGEPGSEGTRGLAGLWGIQGAKGDRGAEGEDSLHIRTKNGYASKREVVFATACCLIASLLTLFCGRRKTKKVLKLAASLKEGDRARSAEEVNDLVSADGLDDEGKGGSADGGSTPPKSGTKRYEDEFPQSYEDEFPQEY